MHQKEESIDQKILSQIDIYVDTIKIINIDRNKLKNDILANMAFEERLSKNSMDYSYEDFKIPYCSPLQQIEDYIRDHFNCDYQKTLIPLLRWGNIYNPGESSFTRNQIDPLHVDTAPDYTCIYGVDVAKGSSKFVMEYDDNTRKGCNWHIPLENNQFIIFPSTQRYFISRNTSKQMNIFLTINCEYK